MDNKNFENERRRARRVRISLSVIYKINEPIAVRLLTANREINATMLDLSEEGMAIATDYDIPEATVMLIRFTLFKVEKDDISFYGPVEIAGEVRYNSKKYGESRIGIRFTKIDEDDKREIANFANRIRDTLSKNQKKPAEDY